MNLHSSRGLSRLPFARPIAGAESHMAPLYWPCKPCAKPTAIQTAERLPRLS
ncbi:protein of unknown function [Methylocella tundrae]|uniref:Uncharacterized protein n=1 Tax=Methylocella tundrae TaxID=227605 RepID=A0A4U8Z2V1_METTU|nr:protein of unknown function [Methylocella tundrae]